MKYYIKMKSILLILLATFLISSCSTNLNYIQVFKSEFKDGIIKDNSVVYENNDLIVKYNLLSHKGNLSFTVFNNSNEDIIIDLGKSFFIFNSQVKDYYIQQTIEQSMSYTNSVYLLDNSNLYNSINVSNERFNSLKMTTFNMQHLIIPSGTYRIIYKYDIVESYFDHCDLIKFNKTQNKNTINFNESNSPIKCSNIISYTKDNKSSKVKHDFYIKEIGNYDKEELLIDEYQNNCGRKFQFPISVLNLKDPSTFYFEYGRIAK